MQCYRWITLALPLAVIASAQGACKKAASPPPPSEAATPPPEAPPPFAVKSIELGKGITASKQVTNPTTAFGVHDTIYASVVTEGSGPSKTLVARWTYQTGQKVQEQTETIAPTGPAVTEFHITKKTPWPAGKYQVEILVDGSAAGTKEFDITK